jgi:small subunit ribosomal protein S6
MRKYELTVLIHPDLEADLEKPLKKVRELVTSNDGEVVSEDNWGKKRLAYRIKGQDFAVYVSMDVNLPPAVVAKIDGTLNITDEVIRHLLVTVDEKQRAALAAAKERAEKRGQENESSEE